MATRTYVNFDLLIEKEADGSYTALVTGSPVGAASSVRFQLPFNSTALENLLLKLDPGRSGTRRAGANVQQQAAMDFGGPLYDAIFRDDVLLAWSRSKDLAREEGGGLRLRLRLTKAAEIAGLPWELLYDRPNNTFLAQSERTPLVRYLDVPSVPRAIKVDGPLRVLAIIASPADLERLDVEAEWTRLNDAMADRIKAGSVVLDRLPKPLVAELGPWLRRHQTHVIHFVGHGDFDERLREGVVYFENELGARAAVTSSVLGPFVRDHDPLRMVVLNACRAARTDALDPFGGIAQGLVQQDATAVVAMQFPISDRAAVAFTGDFYGSLVDGLPVDQAITSARKALLGVHQDEWATPVLFLRAPDGAIFEDVHVGPNPGPGHWLTARAALAAAAAVVVVAGVAAVVALRSDGGGGAQEGSTTEPTPGSGGRATAVLPVAEVPLTDEQLLVAAGPSQTRLNLYRIDLGDGGSVTPVTVGGGRKAGASISEERDTLIFTEKALNAPNFWLRTADPAAGGSDPLLFEERPAPCAASMERPARSPVDPDLIISPCKDLEGEWSLVELDLASGDYRVLDGTRQRVGDPTLSWDGRYAVYWASATDGAKAGDLYSLDLLDRSATPQQFTFVDGDADAVFSPVEGDYTVAFTRTVSDGDNDLYTRTLGEPDPAAELVPGPTVDQDPTWSPDGTRLAFARQTPTEGMRTYVVDLSGGAPAGPARPLLSEPIAEFEVVPAWSRR